MIGYVCESVILLAGCAFILLMVLAIRRGTNAPESLSALPIELLETQPIGLVSRVHLAPRRMAYSRRRPARRRQPVPAWPPLTHSRDINSGTPLLQKFRGGGLRVWNDRPIGSQPPVPGHAGTEGPEGPGGLHDVVVLGIHPEPKVRAPTGPR